ncbi:hypothetical protein EVAR_478_1 [Eumeta japonica]|uniref:Uncharacterized protein n=1 Tax=Eumeta variegata TaxID=151549 RepID=A0A4C1SAM8_EUMVA|nr:hypothetical protein EVAR_478_1 [Eumeta japonica]
MTRGSRSSLRFSVQIRADPLHGASHSDGTKTCVYGKIELDTWRESKTGSLVTAADRGRRGRPSPVN